MLYAFTYVYKCSCIWCTYTQRTYLHDSDAHCLSTLERIFKTQSTSNCICHVSVVGWMAVAVYTPTAPHFCVNFSRGDTARGHDLPHNHSALLTIQPRCPPAALQCRRRRCCMPWLERWEIVGHHVTEHTVESFFLCSIFSHMAHTQRGFK